MRTSIRIGRCDDMEDEKSGIDQSDVSAAASAHSRINIPLNLENWRDQPADVQKALMWFHQHILDEKMDWEDAKKALGYDNSVIFKVLKGSYEGSWKNVSKAIEGYKRLADQRGTIQQNEVVENHMMRLIHGGLDYAMANNSITMITGESRMGKTVSALRWRDLNNHGQSVYVSVPALGGTKVLLRKIAEAVGVNKNLAMVQIYEAICRSFNKNRMLIVDEAHRLLPQDRRSNPVNLELLRDIHDTTHCALALIATQRFDDELKKSQYMFEQILGRVGMPVRLPRRIKENDIMPILQQYIKEPTQRIVDMAVAVANELGRLGILVETLKIGSRIARKNKVEMTDSHFIIGLKARQQMMGECQYAKS